MSDGDENVLSELYSSLIPIGDLENDNVFQNALDPRYVTVACMTNGHQHLLMNYSPNTITLHTYLTRSDANTLEMELPQLLFQIYFVLNCLLTNYAHGQLDPHNVLLVPLPNNEVLHFSYKNKYITIHFPCRYIIKMVANNTSFFSCPQGSTQSAHQKLANSDCTPLRPKVYQASESVDYQLIPRIDASFTSGANKPPFFTSLLNSLISKQTQNVKSLVTYLQYLLTNATRIQNMTAFYQKHPISGTLTVSDDTKMVFVPTTPISSSTS